MRSILEQVSVNPNSSFRLLVDPKLHDFYYWHFHPELELVYIEGVDGQRHIGNHKSKYFEGDLALIGPFIPHLNFDYGVKEKYFKIVLQFSQSTFDFYKGDHPELANIRQLFHDSSHGIVFNSKLKQKVGPMMKKLAELKGFDFFHFTLKLLNLLAQPDSYKLLHKQPYQNQFYEKQQGKIRKVMNFIESNYQNKIKVAELAKLCNYSEGAFCRYFKKMTKLSFTKFLNNYRIDMAKRLLLDGNNVTEAAYASGFESISYFNRVFKNATGYAPSKWKNRNTMINGMGNY